MEQANGARYIRDLVRDGRVARVRVNSRTQCARHAGPVHATHSVSVCFSHTVPTYRSLMKRDCCRETQAASDAGGVTRVAPVNRRACEKVCDERLDTYAGRGQV